MNNCHTTAELQQDVRVTKEEYIADRDICAGSTARAFPFAALMTANMHPLPLYMQLYLHRNKHNTSAE
jgi:hypothetical protein